MGFIFIRMKLLRILIVISLVFSTVGYGQNALRLDSLRTLLHQEASELEKRTLVKQYLEAIEKDTAYISLLIIEKDACLLNDEYDNALFYTNALVDYGISSQLELERLYAIFESFEDHIPKCKSPFLVGDFYINYAQIATFLQKYDASLEILDRGIVRMEKYGADSLFAYAQMYLTAGENSTKTNNLVRSATYFKRASELFLYQKDTISYLWSQNGLSRLFGNNGLYQEAEDARRPIFELEDKINVIDVVVMAHVTAAIEGTMQHNKAKELYHVEEALKRIDKMSSDIKGIIEILSRVCASYIYARHNLLEKSDTNLLIMKSLMKGVKDNAYLHTHCALALSQNAYAHGNYKAAEKHLIDLLDALRASKEIENILEYEHLLAQIYYKMGDTEKSLAFYKSYSNIKDSIQKSTSRKRFAYVQNQFEVEKKDLEIARQKKDIVLLATENRVKRQGLIFGGLGLISLFTFIYLYRSREFAKRKQHLQKQFSQKLMQQQEQERTRIARELHDGVGQQLTLIKRKTQSEQHTQLTELTNGVLEEVRAISRGLYPPMLDKLGLTLAIEQFINDLDSESDFFVTTEIENIDGYLPQAQYVNVYRFFQEALTNIVKHAAATSLFISMKHSARNIIITIEDNGSGFDTEKVKGAKSLGLRTLAERIKIMKGSFRIKSELNKGTQVKAVIPCII